MRRGAGAAAAAGAGAAEARFTGFGAGNDNGNGACQPGYDYCGGSCVDTMRTIEHCGGCSDRDIRGRVRGVDCSIMTDGEVDCVRGICVVPEVQRDLW